VCVCVCVCVYRDFKVVPHTVVSDKSAFCRADAQAGDPERLMWQLVLEDTQGAEFLFPRDICLFS
jgi:hypothetical protein